MKIKYVIGNATNPLGEGQKIVAHICNDLGKWGKGFVMAVSKKWETTRDQYLEWYNKNEAKLGEVQFIRVGSHITIANMIGQKGIKTGSNGSPIRYDYLEQCFEKLRIEAEKNQASIHMPRIGCGLAGGKWPRVEELINKVFGDTNIEITIYTLADEIREYPKVDYEQ
jgi:O-acetyl-ADP-ribose deacetylase (regulator of RNase III)